MDRVTGGVYWTTGSSSIGLMTARVHHGTALPDASVLALPRPNRALLEKRMAHLGRNALALATRLETFLAAHPSSPIARVNYPGLSSYPGFAWTKEMNFHGCFFTLTWNAHHQNVFTYKAFINRVMDEARKRGADIVSGTSFGFSTTRVYLTALHATGVTKPFVRISVGTETAEELRVIGDVLESAML
jgi:cystathionine beta-lyase/cystathionine gamma-synthase